MQLPGCNKKQIWYYIFSSISYFFLFSSIFLYFLYLIFCAGYESEKEAESSKIAALRQCSKKSFSTFFILSFFHVLYSLFHTYFHILYLVQRRKVKMRRNRLKLQLAGNAAQIWCYWKFFEFSTNICRPASRSLNQTKTWEKSFRDIFSRCVCLHWFWLRIC